MKKSRKIFSIETDEEINALIDEHKPEITTVKSAGAYCNLNGGFCKPLNCESCSLLKNEYPHSTWRCSSCLDTRLKVVPFWGEIECDNCGNDNGVMMLCVHKKRKSIR